MRYKVLAATDQGPYRKTNQDSVITCKKEFLEKEIVLAVVCDGMGGLEDGEIASRLAVEAFADWFYAYWADINQFPIKDQLIDEWKTLIEGINTKIFNHSLSVSSRMGTTLSALLLFNNQFIIGHVGDSRIYLINQTGIRQLTEDHSLVAQEIRRGLLTAENARNDKRKHLLTQCIGLKNTVTPQFLSGNIKEHDYYLICSDGLWNKTNEEEIRQIILCQTNIENQLINAARRYNEKDNISVVVLKAENSSESIKASTQKIIVACILIMILVGWIVIIRLFM